MLRKTLCRPAPHCQFHLPFSSYCDVAQAWNYFAFAVESYVNIASRGMFIFAQQRMHLPILRSQDR